MNVLLYLVILVVCCLYAIVRGGPPERLGALALIAAVVATRFVPASGTIRFQTIEYGVMAVDMTLLIAIVVIAIRAQRYWPMWMAAILLDTVVTHLLMLSPKLIPWSYSVMIAAWSYPMPLILAIGTWRHQTRARSYGDDPAWNP
jgi:hypothetical protein